MPLLLLLLRPEFVGPISYFVKVYFLWHVVSGLSFVLLFAGRAAAKPAYVVSVKREAVHAKISHDFGKTLDVVIAKGCVETKFRVVCRVVPDLLLEVGIFPPTH